MKTVRTKGIIIAEKIMSDFDKVVTILTPNIGKIECVAKGARRSKSLLLAGTQFLCFGDYLLYKGGDTYRMNACETIEVFYNIRIDLDKLKCASYLTKIVNDVTTENQNNYRILQLFLNTLYILANTDKDLKFVESIFRIRLLSIIGFRPIIDECVSCKQKENLNHFSIKDNGLKCNNCSKQEPGAIAITETTRDAIRYIILSDAKRIYSFNVPEESIKELEIVSKLYLTEKLEKEFKV